MGPQSQPGRVWERLRGVKGAQKTGWEGEGVLLLLEGVFLGAGTSRCPGRAPGEQDLVCMSEGLRVAGNPLSVTDKPGHTAGT